VLKKYREGIKQCGASISSCKDKEDKYKDRRGKEDTARKNIEENGSHPHIRSKHEMFK